MDDSIDAYLDREEARGWAEARAGVEGVTREVGMGKGVLGIAGAVLFGAAVGGLWGRRAAPNNQPPSSRSRTRGGLLDEVWAIFRPVTGEIAIQFVEQLMLRARRPGPPAGPAGSATQGQPTSQPQG